jgi:hypothetical protein
MVASTLVPTMAQPRTAAPTSLPAARLALGAAGAFLFLLSAAHLAKPDLDPSWRPISEYALGDFGWVMTLAFLSWGLSAIGVFVALRSHVPTRGGRIGLAFLLVGGAGPILAGIFPTDPITTAPDAMTTTGSLHSLGAVLADGIPIGAALITWSLVRKNPAWAPARRHLVLVTVLAWIGFAVLTVSMAVLLPESGGQLGPDVPVGWPGRFLVAAYAAWLLVAAGSAITLSRRSS